MDPTEPYHDLNHPLGEPLYFSATEGTTRQLRLEVIKDTITGFWDERPFVIIHRATELNRTWKGIEVDAHGLAANWLIAESPERLGLLCEGGTCVFSDAVLEPLP
jgi:hypothetical protein